MSPADPRRPVHSARIASRTYGDESVIVSPREQTVRMLNPVGSRIWELIDGERTPTDIAAALTEEFAVDLPHAERSVADFLRELEARQLLEWH